VPRARAHPSHVGRALHLGAVRQPADAARALQIGDADLLEPISSVVALEQRADARVRRGGEIEIPISELDLPLAARVALPASEVRLDGLNPATARFPDPERDVLLGKPAIGRVVVATDEVLGLRCPLATAPQRTLEARELRRLGSELELVLARHAGDESSGAPVRVSDTRAR
jgi:hypothetical protein